MKKQLIIIFGIIVIGIVLVWLYTSFFKTAPAYVAAPADGSKVATCDVCKYGKGITDHKSVQYCSMCDAWICKDCQPNLALRAVAMINRSFDPTAATYRS